MAEVAELPVRDRIVATAGELLRQRGYAAASMRDIVEAAKAPRGSLQHYFPGGKGQLAVEAITVGRTRVSGFIDLAFERTRTAHGALRWFFEHTIELLIESDYAFGCPVATVALEHAILRDEVADACAATLGEWTDRFAAGFAAHGIPARQARRLATITLSQYEGSMLLARVAHDAEPMRTAGAILQELAEEATP